MSACVYWCEVTASLLWQIAGESFIVNSSAQDGVHFFQEDFNFTSVTVNMMTMMVAIVILPSQPTSNGVTCSSASNKLALNMPMLQVQTLAI